MERAKDENIMKGGASKWKVMHLNHSARTTVTRMMQYVSEHGLRTVFRVRMRKV